MILLVVSLPIAFAVELSLIYDANGNLVTGDGKYRGYNSLNELFKVHNGIDSSVGESIFAAARLRRDFRPDLWRVRNWVQDCGGKDCPYQKFGKPWVSVGLGGCFTDDP